VSDAEGATLSNGEVSGLDGGADMVGVGDVPDGGTRRTTLAAGAGTQRPQGFWCRNPLEPPFARRRSHRRRSGPAYGNVQAVRNFCAGAGCRRHWWCADASPLLPN